PELLVLVVVELVVQFVVLVEIVQVLLIKLVLIQLVVEVFVQVLVFLEVSELLFVETAATTLERPVRRLTRQHCHPQLTLWLVNELPDAALYDSSADRAFRASLRRSVAPSARLRSRLDDGVTSIHASSSTYSSAAPTAAPPTDRSRKTGGA